MSDKFNIDLNEVRAFLAEKEAKRQAALDDSFRQATADFDCIVEHIVAEYDPKRIWQWGSLLKRSRFTEISDIDIALEGISDPKAFFRILGKASQLTAFPVDIVEMERIGTENAEFIRSRGRLVYER